MISGAIEGGFFYDKYLIFNRIGKKDKPWKVTDIEYIKEKLLMIKLGSISAALSRSVHGLILRRSAGNRAYPRESCLLSWFE